MTPPASPARILCVPEKGNSPQRKNGPVIQTCEQCGAINQSSADVCCFCDARLDAPAEHAAVAVSNRAHAADSIPTPNTRAVAAAASASTHTVTRATPKASGKGAFVLGPDWRAEVTQRMRSYRERRRKSGASDSQTALAFGQEIEAQSEADVEDHIEIRTEEPEERFVHPLDEGVLDGGVDAAAALDEDQYEDPLQATLAAASARMSVEPARRSVPEEPEEVQHLLIDVSRPPEINFEQNAEHAVAPQEEISASLNSDLRPVATLAVRRRAATVDVVCLAAAYAGVLGLFAYFGGKLAPGRLDAFVFGAILALLYTQYFTMFTMMGGATPGMMYAGLRLVSFDGSAPQPRQLIWRSFGYLISGGTAFLGFLWAFWDEDHLSWHDRISQTYITPADAVFEPSSSIQSQ